MFEDNANPGPRHAVRRCSSTINGSPQSPIKFAISEKRKRPSPITLRRVPWIFANVCVLFFRDTARSRAAGLLVLSSHINYVQNHFEL